MWRAEIYIVSKMISKIVIFGQAGITTILDGMYAIHDMHHII